MDRLWSPWRYDFISQRSPGDVCVFCSIGAASDEDDQNFVIHRGKDNFVILNRYPYTAGHMMIVPYIHASSLGDAEEAPREMMYLTIACERALNEIYRPDGINLGMNLGTAAGAGIAGHIHMHVLPRWTGDANFLSTIGETRMLPEELPLTWNKLRAWFSNY